MKRWLRRLGIVAAIVSSVGFIAYVLSSLQLSDLATHFSGRSLAALAFSVFLYSMILPLSATAWRLMLADMGHKDRFGPLHAILLTTQAGKYLPGNVGQHIGRIGLSLARKIPLPILIASMAYEVVLLLFADMLVAVSAGAASGPGLQLLFHGHAQPLVVAAFIIGAGLVAIPLISRHMPAIIRRVTRNRDHSVDKVHPLRWRTLLGVLVLYASAMVSVGAAISVLGHGLFPGVRIDHPLLTAAFAIAWAVGFVTPGAPAGIGVREGILLLILGGSLGAANASVLILALRIATTLGDILCFVAGFALTAYLRRSGSRASPATQGSR